MNGHEYLIFDELKQNEVNRENKKGFDKLQILVWSSFEKYQSLVQVYV